MAHGCGFRHDGAMMTPSASLWSPAAQRERRTGLFEVYRSHMAGVIDESGGWHGEERPQGYREKLWHAMAYLAGSPEDAAYANKVLRSLDLPPCHFAPLNAMQILRKYALEPTTEHMLLKYVRSSIPAQMSHRTQFAMYNPNFASMATAFLILAGEETANPEALERGAELLDDLRRVFTRCGTIMEYGSATYAPITTLAMAEIVNYANDQALVAMARECEHRMWAEITTHYHLPSAQLGGPYSRAYWIDSVGHCTALHGFLHYAFGDAIVVNPARDVFPPRENQVGHIGNATLMWPNHVWLATAELHCPDDLARLLLDPTKEMVTIARTECIPCRTEGEILDENGQVCGTYQNPWEYGAFSGPNYSYQTSAFSLGTACSQFHDGGLSESMVLTYPVSSTLPAGAALPAGTVASRLEESRIVLLRYLINDREPEQDNMYSVYGPANPSGFRDEARKFGIQHRDCSLVVYTPKQYEKHSVSSLRLSVMIPCHFAPIGEIQIDGRTITPDDRLPVKLNTIRPVYFRDGAVSAAVVPLEITDHGGGGTVIERRGNYLLISYVNYHGERRSFTERELFLTASGCIIHAKPAAEWTLSRLREHVGTFRLSDRYREQLGGIIRWIRYWNEEVELEFAYSPLSEGIMVASVNGRPRPDPVFSCSAMEMHQLPFLA